MSNSNNVYRLRPSSAFKWVRCAGFVGMSEQYPDIPGSSDDTVREEGIAGHWAAHRIGAGDWIPEGDTAPNGVTLNEELLDGAHMFVNELVRWGCPVQQELALPAPLIHADCGGTSDGWGYHKEAKLIRLGDLKMGYRYVDVFENWQLLCYLSSILSYLNIDGYEELAHDVEFVIVQPRTYGSRDGPIRRWRVPVSNLRGQFNRLRRAAIAATSDNPLLTTGTHCEDCSARYACPAFQKASLDVLEISDRAIPNELTPVQLGVALARLQRAQLIIDSMEKGLAAQAMHLIKQGAMVLNYEAAPTFGRLNWKEGINEEVLAVAQLLGADIKKPQQLKTPTQCAKLLPAKFITQYAERRNNGLKLTRVDDNQIRKFLSRTDNHGN